MSTGTRTTAEPAVDPYIWAVLTVAVATQTAGSVVSQGVYILVPLWRDAFGISLGAASLAVTVMNLAQIATMFLLGKAIDRHGERSVVGLTMLVMGLAMAGAAMLAHDLATLLVFMAIMGGAYASVQPGGTRAIMRWFPPRHRGLATGFRQAAVPFGTAIAAFLLPLLAAALGWQAALWLQAAMAVAGGALFWTCYREGNGSATRSEAPLPLRELLQVLGRSRDFWPVLAAGIAMSGFQFTMTAHAIGFLADDLGLGIAAAASLFGITQVMGIPGRVLLPWLSDRFLPARRPRALGWIMLLSAAALMALMTCQPATPMPLLVGILVVLGLFGIGWFPIYLLQMAETAPKSSIASTVSFATTLCMMAMALGPFLFGLLVDLAGYGMAWGALLVPVVLTALPLCRSRARP